MKKIVNRMIRILVFMCVLNVFITSFINAESFEYEKLLVIEFGRENRIVPQFERMLEGTNPKAYNNIEKKLLPLLEKPNATLYSKVFICKMLSIVGTKDSVPYLEKMLYNKKLSFYASHALKGVPGPEATDAFIKAVKSVKPEIKSGVISVLGERGEWPAVPVISRQISKNNEELSRVSILALKRLCLKAETPPAEQGFLSRTLGLSSSKDIVKVLQEADINKELEPLRDEALVNCAEKMFEWGDELKAVEIYEKLLTSEKPVQSRARAIIGLAKIKKEKTLPHVLNFLRSKNERLIYTGIQAFKETPGDMATEKVFEEMNNLSDDKKLLILSAMEIRNDRSAIPYIKKFVKYDNEEVQKQALQVIGKLGSGSEVEYLVDLCMQTNEQGTLAFNTICDLKGEDVLKKLEEIGKQGEISRQVKIIDIIGNRYERAGLSYFYEMVKNENIEIRKAVYRNFENIAGIEELPTLLGLFININDSAERKFLEPSIGAITVKVTNSDKYVGQIVEFYKQADSSLQYDLMIVLSGMGGDKAYEIVKKNLKTGNSKKKKEVIKILNRWKDEKPLPDLWQIITDDKDLTRHVLALRGYVELIKKHSRKDDAVKRVEMLKKAMFAARRIDEKRLILGAVAEFKTKESKEFLEIYMDDAVLREEAKAGLKKLSGKKSGKKNKKNKKDKNKKL